MVVLIRVSFVSLWCTTSLQSVLPVRVSSTFTHQAQPSSCFLHLRLPSHLSLLQCVSSLRHVHCAKKDSEGEGAGAG